MYTNFFGLTKKPFSLSPDPSFLYLSPNHKKALTTLRYGLVSQASITVITGEIGSGKTTLIMAVLEKVQNQCTVGLITNTHSAFGDLLTWVLASFDIPHESKNKAERYQIFTRFLAEEHKKQRRVILIVDEAQNMDIETLEELRLLSNINVADQIKLQMILVGQPELVDKLNQPELVQFAQRISIEYHLKPLNFEETRNYIAHRLLIAGVNSTIFNEAALAAIYFYTEGVPRLINNICDLAMVFAFAAETKKIGWKTITEVVNERKTGGIRRFKGTISTEPTLMDRATEAERLRRDILDKTKIDISRSL
ncbi:general secretion pathway protein A [Methyloglobulus morosus KoM1]|jgi:general secretion pathway protein A|uniref:General secretion pathway protein A n=1 Tax=Methyloglobulus morosus KoM1 TaxID=1116472 RepID=V5C1C5_9GAMM|nr:AAA family ATPase [Methyloglobulus morosus]ESS73904.1 general secretion pathway protein A [Methyloglobulus morosus KoM1]